MSNLKGKVAVVTGSTKGIGLAIAERLHAAGAGVVVSSRTANDVAAVAKRLGAPAIGIPCDVGDPAACERLIGETVERLGRLDILVNNAGFGIFKSINELSVEEWRRQIDVNLGGVFYCSKAAMPHLSATGDGFIVNIGSLAGRNFFAGGTGQGRARRHDRGDDARRAPRRRPGIDRHAGLREHALSG
jgi:3-oxoacyl-[acyl-carrier protein] reductase